jgi:hypothetical protein
VNEDIESLKKQIKEKKALLNVPEDIDFAKYLSNNSQDVRQDVPQDDDDDISQGYEEVKLGLIPSFIL